MKIKHWAGYGCVNAKCNLRHKIASTGDAVITIEVWGNHERGLQPPYFDYSDWHRWLGKRYHMDRIVYVCTDNFYVKDVEHMVVTFETKEV